MLIHPQFDPIAIHLGSFGIHWYGLMYLTGFVAFIVLGRWRIAHQNWQGWTPQMLDDALFFGLEIFALWQGGMSFHGGFLGVLAAMVVFSRKYQKPWLSIMDFVAPLVPIGLGAGRMGNFINGELWGRPTDVPWGMVFPRVDDLARHPSQLYEFGLEGIVLFGLLRWYSSNPRAVGGISASFLLGYGSFQFIAEFTREPDSYLGLLSLGMSMGQWLSLPMIIFGLWLYRFSCRNK